MPNYAGSTVSTCVVSKPAHNCNSSLSVSALQERSRLNWWGKSRFELCGMGSSGQDPKIGEIQKMEIQFFHIENNSMSMSFGKKVSYSVGDYKNVKTGQQCMSLMEKLNFIFFSISLFSGIAQLCMFRCKAECIVAGKCM